MTLTDKRGLHRSRAPHARLADATVVGSEKRLDRLLEFLAFVARPIPLPTLLDEAPRKIAAIVGAQIASLYLLEGEGDELVMRGNVGFPSKARGRVRLSVGEGITGMAVEKLRPIAVVAAAEHRSFKSFPELDENRFPVFLAVPIIGSAGALGALVVQRAGERAFRRSDVNLLTALTAPISAALRQAHLLDDQRERTRRTGGGTRKVTLPGEPVVPGRALGAIAALRRPAASAQKKGADDPRMLKLAFEVADRSLGALVATAMGRGLAADAAFLQNYLLMVSDSRLRGRAYELASSGMGVAEALSTVAREVTRASSMVGDKFMQERARDIEDLCNALLMLAAPDARAELPAKAVLLVDELTVFDLLVSARAHPVGIALTKEVASPRTKVLLQLMGLPAIADVGNAFRWASPGDVALLDADHGFLVINPSRAEVASVRAERRHTSLPADRESGPGER